MAWLLLIQAQFQFLLRYIVSTTSQYCAISATLTAWKSFMAIKKVSTSLSPPLLIRNPSEKVFNEKKSCRIYAVYSIYTHQSVVVKNVRASCWCLYNQLSIGKQINPYSLLPFVFCAGIKIGKLLTDC